MPVSLSLSKTDAPKAKRQIRRLPKEIIKGGEYGPEYEEWRRAEDEKERLTSLKPDLLTQAFESEGLQQQGQQQGQQQQQQQQQKGSKSRNKGGSSSPNRIKIEVVERGVPLRKWFLIKWQVEQASESGDSVCLFEEDVSVSNEVWSLPLR
jgi:hypothetical protein